jgi:hypothetical protein
MARSAQESEKLRKPRRRTRADRRDATKGDVQLCKSLTSLGMPTWAVAEEIGISKDTLERWMKDYPEIDAAIKKGRSLRRERSYTCFFQQAFPVERLENGKSKPTGKGDPSLMIFWMKTRERWKEPPKDVRIQGAADAPIIEFAIKEPTKKESED